MRHSSLHPSEGSRHWAVSFNATLFEAGAFISRGGGAPRLAEPPSRPQPVKAGAGLPKPMSFNGSSGQLSETENRATGTHKGTKDRAGGMETKNETERKSQAGISSDGEGVKERDREKTRAETSRYT